MKTTLLLFGQLPVKFNKNLHRMRNVNECLYSCLFVLYLLYCLSEVVNFVSVNDRWAGPAASQLRQTSLRGWPSGCGPSHCVYVCTPTPGRRRLNIITRHHMRVHTRHWRRTCTTVTDSWHSLHTWHWSLHSLDTGH